MKERLRQDPFDIIRLNENKLRILTHCGLQNGIVYYITQKGVINVADYYYTIKNPRLKSGIF